jgi:hypothetical protein
LTLLDFYQFIDTKPLWVMTYFIGLPIGALLIGFISKQNAVNSQWRYVFSGLIYLVSIPGVFSITLLVYQFFFERKSIMDINLVTQLTPIISMICTFYIIKRFVNLNNIPGFNRLGNLVVIIAASIFLLWILEKTRIMIFSFMPLQYLLILFVGILIVIRFAWQRISK